MTTTTGIEKLGPNPIVASAILREKVFFVYSSLSFEQKQPNFLDVLQSSLCSFDFKCVELFKFFFLNVGDGTPRALGVELSHSFHSQWLSPSIDDEIIFFLLVNPKMNFSSFFYLFIYFFLTAGILLNFFQSVNQRLWSIGSQMAVNWLDFSLGFPNNLCQHDSPEALHINIIQTLHEL